MATVSLIGAHEVFNMYNNMLPLLVIDVMVPRSASGGEEPRDERQGVLTITGSFLVPEAKMSSSSAVAAVVQSCFDRMKCIGMPDLFVVFLVERGSAVEDLMHHVPLARIRDAALLEGEARFSLQRAVFACRNEIFAKYSLLVTPPGAKVASFLEYRALGDVGCDLTDPLARCKSRAQRKKYFATEVLPNELFLGDFQNATDAEQLVGLGITHVVDASNEQISRPVCAEHSIEYLAIDIADHPAADISGYFGLVIDFVHSARRSAVKERPSKVLIHCRAGISRSATLVVAFLMTYLQVTLAEALRMVIGQRPIIFPNPGFLQHLMELEKNIRKTEEPSFRDHTEAMTFLSKRAILWSPLISSASTTDFDRILVRPAGVAPNAEDERPPEGFEPPKRPLKPFLKRGSANATRRPRE